MPKSRSQILLEEKVDRIDDENFEELFDEKTSDETTSQNIVVNLPSMDEVEKTESAFSIEVQPNEFLDTFALSKTVTPKKPSKVHVNKPLILTLMSIATLLCILFIYNLFELGTLAHLKSVAVPMGNVNAVVLDETPNVLTFENGKTLQIERFI